MNPPNLETPGGQCEKPLPQRNTPADRENFRLLRQMLAEPVSSGTKPPSEGFRSTSVGELSPE